MKVVFNQDIIICPKEKVLVESTCIIGKGILEYCQHIFKNDKIPLTLTPEGYISTLFSRRVVWKLANCKGKTIKLSCGTKVAYIIANILH